MSACGIPSLFSNRSIIANPKAAVFPVPVLACPMMSLVPRSIAGITFFWIGVGSTNPFSSMAFIASCDSPKALKLSVFFKSLSSFRFFKKKVPFFRDRNFSVILTIPL